MAPKLVITPTKSSLLFLVLMLMFIGSASASSSPRVVKETKMKIYLHDFDAGPNINFPAVAGIQGKRWSLADYGTVFVTDEIIKEGISIDSPTIGRAQGIYTVSSSDGSGAFWSTSLVFTNKAYYGSTLELQGRTDQRVNATSEVSIVSGTGKFRFARGYVTAYIAVGNVFTDHYVVLECDIMVRHD